MNNRVFVAAWLLVAVVVPGPSATAAPIDPAALSPLLHLRADQGVFTDVPGTTPAANGDFIRHWADQGTANSDATYGIFVGDERRPTYQSSGFGVNNLPAIRFDGFNDVLFQPVIVPNGPQTVFVVYQSDGVGAGQTDSIFNFKLNLATAFTEAMLINNVAGYQPITFKAAYDSGTGLGLNATLDTQEHLLAFVYEGGGNSAPANYDAILDGLSAAVVASGAVGRNAGVGAIGRRVNADGTAANGDLPFDGAIAEIVFFDRALTADEFAGVSEFLHNKYFVEPTADVVPEPASVGLWMLLAVVVAVSLGRGIVPARVGRP